MPTRYWQDQRTGNRALGTAGRLSVPNQPANAAKTPYPVAGLDWVLDVMYTQQVVDPCSCRDEFAPGIVVQQCFIKHGDQPRAGQALRQGQKGDKRQPG